MSGLSGFEKGETLMSRTAVNGSVHQPGISTTTEDARISTQVSLPPFKKPDKPDIDSRFSFVEAKTACRIGFKNPTLMSDSLSGFGARMVIPREDE